MSKTIHSVGIDVSQATLDVALLTQTKTNTQQTFTNNVTGLKTLITYLTQHGVTKVTPCVIESTGDLHLLASVTLVKAGFLVNVINPLITKRYQQASIRDAKTDALDAARLAQIGIMEEGLMPFAGDTKAINARKMLSLLGRLEKMRQQLKTSLGRYQATAEQLDISVPGNLDTVVTSLDDQITELKEQLRIMAPSTAKQLADHISGVSETQAATLMAMLQGTSFSNRDQLVAFVGLDVRPRRSGQWRGREKLSKRGNPYIRKVLYQIAWGLRLNNPTYRKYYEKQRAAGKHYNTCMTAVARKFVRFFYAYHCQKGGVRLSTEI